MKDIPFAKDLYLYTGSTFHGSLIIKDVHGEPYMIDQDDEIRLYFKPVDNDSGKETVQITLTSNDEIMGEYPFKLTAEITESIEGDYEGIGHLVIGYAAKPAADPAPRKAGYICKV